MKFTFKWNKPLNQIEKNLGFGQSLNLFMANEAIRFMAKYTPMESGTLFESAKAVATAREGQVFYPGPYAHYQYTGKLMVSPSGSAWAKAGEIKQYASPVKFLDYNVEKHPLATAYWEKAMMAAEGAKYKRSINRYRKALAK